MNAWPIAGGLVFARSVVRSAMVLAMLTLAVLDGLLRKVLLGMQPGAQGAVWVHGWCRRIVWALGLRCSVEGPLPDACGGMAAVVSNHLSYLDILVYAAQRPFVMVAKTEVRSWPLLGWLTAQAGTVYVQRSDMKAALPESEWQTHADVNTAMAAAFRSGLPVMFFPEGTTTDGQGGVLPFRRGLFNSVLYDRVPLRTAAIGYELGRGNAGATAAEALCYCGDDAFAPHLFRMLGLQGVTVEMRFSAAVVDGQDRFRLAANARMQVQEMYFGLCAGQEMAAMQCGEDLFDGPVEGLAAVYGEGGVSG